MADAAESRASYWDALLVRTAEEAGCTAILSGDMYDGGTLGACGSSIRLVLMD
jgi:predicted nucleic acid-binding protein